jgi:hypothetical protein
LARIAFFSVAAAAVAAAASGEKASMRPGNDTAPLLLPLFVAVFRTGLTKNAEVAIPIYWNYMIDASPAAAAASKPW